MNEFFGKNIISVRDLDKQKLESIFDATNKIIDMGGDQRREIARGKTLGYLFFEPSTRTRLSFEAAMSLLGGTSIGIADGLSSSIHKGETLGDTVKIISSYCDVLALRHSLDGSSRFAAETASKPVINAGSGTEEHPTQTIQDLFTIRKEKKKIDGLKIGIAGDLTETNAKVISSVEETSSYKFIPEKDLFDVEYWSLEQAKIKKAKKILEGNVVVITGSTGTIGYASYKMFKSYGAEVVLLDNNLDRLKTAQSKIKDLCIHCDVTNKKSVKSAFKQICEKFGGIDILISNAGTAPGGAIGEVSDDVLRKSFEINFFSHQNCASEAIKIMKKQNINGCLLFNISKQSVNPGKNFGPYGLPKSALLSLCKQYAVDYGSYGIRSNGVNADRIRSGLMTDKMIKNRAKARSLSTDDYMKGNLLLNEVKAEDVAKAFFHLATSKKTTGAVLTVDGGNIAASLR